MRLTFVNDGPVFYDEQGVYYEFAYHELFERYSYLADEISFLIRTIPLDTEKKFTKIPEQIKIISVADLKRFDLSIQERKKAEVIIKETVKRSDCLILRVPSLFAQIAIKYIEKYNKPYIVECVGCAWDSYWNHSMLGKFVAPYMFFTMKKIVKDSKYVYYVTEKFLQKRYPTKGRMVSCSNVILDQVMENVLQKRLSKLDAFIGQTKIILGTAAAIDTRYKGQEYVIKAIPQLESLGYTIEYRLAGGKNNIKANTYLQDLAKKTGVEDKVIFLGALPADKMMEYYDQLDIYVQPSKQEGLPRAVIEAMSRGCPVIGTNIAGIPELIKPECLFKKGSVIAFIVALQRIMKMDLKTVAKQNFENAKKYTKYRLERQRNVFYDDFLKEINLHKTM